MHESVIIFSCINNVLLKPMIDACQQAGLIVEGVIMDGELPLSDQENVRARLEPEYRIAGLADFDYPSIPFYFVKDHNSKGVVAKVTAMKSRYVINAGTPRILKGDILKTNKYFLNCHPGILPKYRGCTCVEWALYNNDPVGATVYFMDEGIDEGPIVLQGTLDISFFSSYETIRTRMIGFTAGLMVEGVKKCYKENLIPDTMPPQEAGSYFKPIPEDKLMEVKKKVLGIGKK
ncbi:MAG: hypothetical protein JW734_08880 [Candidatus Omnitrophica bacterium]|nr:hypothetical protein [Candidatus Omnitrophota bacterium]